MLITQIYPASQKRTNKQSSKNCFEEIEYKEIVKPKIPCGQTCDPGGFDIDYDYAGATVSLGGFQKVKGSSFEMALLPFSTGSLVWHDDDDDDDDDDSD